MQSAMQEILNQIDRAKPFLLNALRENQTGSECAQMVLKFAPKDYAGLRMISIQVNDNGASKTLSGRDAVWLLIQNTPDIWEEEIAPGVPLKTQQPRVMQFLTEFFNYQPIPVN